MSNRLRFSLTPHLRIDEGFAAGGREEQERSCFHTQHHESHLSVVSLCSDGSLLFVDPFQRPSQDWRYENGPKLEDFLGCCYSNSPSADGTSKVYCQTQEDQNQHNACARINVNITPSFSINGDLETTQNLPNPSAIIQSHQHHYSDNPQAIISAENHLPHIGPTHTHNHNNGMYHQHVPFESTTSVYGFKSWLRQTPFSSGEKSAASNNHRGTNCRFLSLSLAMNLSSEYNGGNIVAVSPSQGMVDRRKRPGEKLLLENRHRWTRRCDAHLWDNSCRKEGQTGKGRQVNLGVYDKEEKAARAYDLAALKYWGPTSHINFPLSTYEKDVEEMKHMTRQEFVANLRRESSGFSRGASVYRFMTRHRRHGRWQARIGRVAGNKDLYLGTFSKQEEAAEAYDIAAIKFRGTSAVTNFDTSRYDVKRICSSSTLIASDHAKRSPKNSAPLALEDCNSFASSTSPQPLAISNGEASDDLVHMTWSANSDDHQHHNTDTNNDISFVAPSRRRNSSNPQRQKCFVGLASEFGISGGDYSQGYFSLRGPKYEDGDNRSDHVSASNNKLVNLGLVHQVNMFALWND